MKFRTELPVPKFPFQISYQDPILLLGSCFSDHIGTFLSKNRFFVHSNPFGTLFNPVSIANTLKMTMDPEFFTDDYRYFFDNHWVSFAHHGSFSHSDENQFIKQINQQWSDTKAFLEQARFLFITFGTAYCYRFIERDLIVANCHKIPNAQFEKSRLEIDEIVQIYREIVQKLQQINPSLKIIFTVSPVRHLGDGFHENQLSKSTLHLAIKQLTDNKNIFYFPAYEILMDDLRDYRFYAEDLCHPGENAVRYIEGIFADAFFSQATKEKQKEIEKENKFLNHRPLK
ncbi:MAG: GSCFA domain-containing protein [Bacteroidetes bacterium]|nr:GSCFA domain-containing protein [Bacteroidota bacterium]MCL2303380.1 GSCFA domain-containing protein [Lentimicrobiaceae bacterium]